MLQDNKSLVSEASEFVFDLLKNKLPAHFVYHNMKHTEEVVAAALKIADKLNLNEDDKEIIALATWFHDTGFIEKGDNHEDFSIETARSFLKNKNFSEDKIELVAGCINATRYPQTPTNILEEVTADADLFHLGTKDYASKSELLRMEWEKTRGKQFTEAEWLKINIDFLTSHKYFTRYARKTLEENKTLTLIKLNNKLRKLNDSIKKSELKEEKRQFEKQKLESKIQSIEEKNKQTQSGIETMFRNTLQKHVEFSSTADRKAGIMIFINTLVIVGIVTFLLEKPEAIPQIIIPTLLLLATSLISLVYAVLSARPDTLSGKFTKKDLESKQANLLFFGNFYNMGQDDFSRGMNEMMNDREFLYGSMTKDFYLLGKMLGRKYEYLRICYNVFMYGMIASVILFTAAYLMSSYSQINIFK